MPVGVGGAAFMRNLPSANYAANVAAWTQETERNVVPLAPVAFTGLNGAKTDIRLPQNGLLADIRLLFKGQLVTTTPTGTVTSTYQWPWNLLKRVTLNANGQTSLINVEGADLRARRQRITRNPREEVLSAIGTDLVGQATGVVGVGNAIPQAIPANTYQLVLEWRVPIVHDYTNLDGALFAQSDQNYLQVSFTPAQTADVLTVTGTATAVVTGTIYPTIVFYDIPVVGSGSQTQVLVPDLSWLHGFTSADNAFTNTGTVKTPFIRTDGQLLAFGWYVDNGSSGLLPFTSLSEARFAYGGNRKPYVFNPMEHLLLENETRYEGLCKPHAWFDFEWENGARDMVYPKGVSELLVELEIPTTVTVQPNARVHFVEDTMYAGV